MKVCKDKAYQVGATARPWPSCRLFTEAFILLVIFKKLSSLYYITTAATNNCETVKSFI